MRECRVSEGIVIGKACRRISGTGQESCYFWLKVKGEDRRNVGLLESLIESTYGCPFRSGVLERIRERVQPSGEGFLGIVYDMLTMPRTMIELTKELRRLNGTLEELAPTIKRIPDFLEPAEGLTDVVRDLRTMLAPLLKWRVVGKRE